MSADNFEELFHLLPGQGERDTRIESYSKRAKVLCHPPSRCQEAANVAGFPSPLVGRSLRRRTVRSRIRGKGTPKTIVPAVTQLGSDQLRRKRLTLELGVGVASHS